MKERTPAEVVEYAQSEGVEIVDIRFMDLPGLMQHFSVPVSELTEDVFEEGFLLLAVAGGCSPKTQSGVVRDPEW